MRILAIDTATQAGGIAVLEGRRVIKNVFERSEEEYSSRLFRQLEFLLVETRLKISEFDLFAVNYGPGSFTGLRIGLSAVKAWAELYRKPICAVSGLKASGSQAAKKSQFIVTFMDARRGQVFGGLFRYRNGGLDTIGDEVLMRPQELLAEISVRLRSGQEAEKAGMPVVFVSPCPDLLTPVLSGSEYQNAPVERVSEDLAPWIGMLAFDQALRGETVTALTLDANYIRTSDAERYWKDS